MNSIQRFLPLILLLFAFCFSMQAQTETTIDGFSDRFYAKIHIEAGYQREVFKKGWIGIFNKHTQEELIHVSTGELAYDNLKKEPEFLFLYEDVNFDGVKDFVVQDGQNSCYHQASYQVFLAKEGRFVFNEAFTKLAQNYCGMFQIDREKELLITYAKSGCCWQEKSEFLVKNGQPIPSRVIQDDGTNPPFRTQTTQVWEDGEMAENVEKSLNLAYGGYEQLLSFTIAKNGKKVVLFSAHDKRLQYAFLDQTGKVEFDFPKEPATEQPDFWYKDVLNSSSVAFRNGSAHYEIYQGKQDGQIHRIGIQVKVNGKTYLMMGDPETVKGDLEMAAKLMLENVGNR